MMSGIASWLLATFVVAPLEAEIDSKLQSAQASRAAVEQVRTCMADAAPRLAERAAGDLVWTVTTAIGVAAGLSEPIDVLAAEAPACRPAIATVRPLLEG